jgi:RNA polymerase sigma-70 factor (ECF subfamily)
VYRVARAILRDDAEAADVVQEANLRAYTHLDQFAGRAAFSTWLTKIAVYLAWDRARRRGRQKEKPGYPQAEETRRKLKSLPVPIRKDRPSARK